MIKSQTKQKIVAIAANELKKLSLMISLAMEYIHKCQHNDDSN